MLMIMIPICVSSEFLFPMVLCDVTTLYGFIGGANKFAPTQTYTYTLPVCTPSISAFGLNSGLSGSSNDSVVQVFSHMA